MCINMKWSWFSFAHNCFEFHIYPAIGADLIMLENEVNKHSELHPSSSSSSEVCLKIKTISFIKYQIKSIKDIVPYEIFYVVLGHSHFSNSEIYIYNKYLNVSKLCMTI